MRRRHRDDAGGKGDGAAPATGVTGLVVGGVGTVVDGVAPVVVGGSVLGGAVDGEAVEGVVEGVGASVPGASDPEGWPPACGPRPCAATRPSPPRGRRYRAGAGRSGRGAEDQPRAQDQRHHGRDGQHVRPPPTRAVVPPSPPLRRSWPPPAAPSTHDRTAGPRGVPAGGPTTKRHGSARPPGGPARERRMRQDSGDAQPTGPHRRFPVAVVDDRAPLGRGHRARNRPRPGMGSDGRSRRRHGDRIRDVDGPAGVSALSAPLAVAPPCHPPA